MRLTVDFSRTTGTAPQVPCVRTDLTLVFMVKFQRATATLKCLDMTTPKLSPFFETSEVKNENAGALHMSQMKRIDKREMKISISKVDFFFGKVKNIGSGHF